MKAILFPADGKPCVVELSEDDNQLGELQGLVGGYIEAVHLYQEILLVNEDGLSKRLPFNRWASRLTGRHIVGNAVLVGSAGVEFASVSDAWIETVADSAK